MRFGMTTAEVRAAVGGEFRSFVKEPGCHPVDILEEADCFVYYDAGGRMKALEFHSRSEPMLGDVNMLSLGFKDLLDLVAAQDPDVEVKIDGFTSLGLGIGSYAPDCEDRPESPSECMIVFRRGYYDEPLK